jgi:hypothetical protein
MVVGQAVPVVPRRYSGLSQQQVTVVWALPTTAPVESRASIEYE